MSDLVLWTFLIIIPVLSIIHTLGEVLYKYGSMMFNPLDKPLEGIDYNIKEQIIPLIVIGVSIGISFFVKIIYGIILVSNPLSISSGLFLGFIAIFSIVFGKFFFNEQISRYQVLGICLIAFGIIILV